MTKTILPGARAGEVTIPSSKSQAHRLLICAALSNAPVTLRIDGLSRDISATMDCLAALGAQFHEENGLISVTLIREIPREAALPVAESGSTLRFLTPIVGALGVKARFLMEGRLPQRPMEPLASELSRHGMRLRQDGATLFCEGQLQSGEYSLPGDVSSQYISGLLFALPLLKGESTLTVTGTLESASYLKLTENALQRSGIFMQKKGNSYHISGNQRATMPASCTVEGDWSNAAFFLCMGALSKRGVLVRGLDMGSAQGDRKVAELLRAFGASVEVCQDAIFVKQAQLRGITIDAAPIPDLVPALAALAACAQGTTRIINAARLRLKESDRIQSTAAMLTSLGARIQELPDGLVIEGQRTLTGGTADAWNDHRIAMAAAVAASACEAPVTVMGAECTEKSFPLFWQRLDGLEVFSQ